MKSLLGLILSTLMISPALAKLNYDDEDATRSQLKRISADFDFHFDYVTIPEGSVTRYLHSWDKDYSIAYRVALNFFHWLFNTITITRRFDIGRYEVTQLEWVAVMGAKLLKKYIYYDYDYVEFNCPNEYALIDGIKFCPYHPMHYVTLYDAEQFIDVLNSNKVLDCQGNIDDPPGCYRLPTKDEWEYAASGGSSTSYFWGNNPEEADKYAWYFDNSFNRIYRVGTKLPNAYGLHDTAGNVAERVSTGLLIGGDYFTSISSLTTYDNDPSYFAVGKGFRLVRAR